MNAGTCVLERRRVVLQNAGACVGAGHDHIINSTHINIHIYIYMCIYILVYIYMCANTNSFICIFIYSQTQLYASHSQRNTCIRKPFCDQSNTTFQNAATHFQALLPPERQHATVTDPRLPQGFEIATHNLRWTVTSHSREFVENSL